MSNFECFPSFLYELQSNLIPITSFKNFDTVYLNNALRSPCRSSGSSSDRQTNRQKCYLFTQNIQSCFNFKAILEVKSKKSLMWLLNKIEIHYKFSTSTNHTVISITLPETFVVLRPMPLRRFNFNLTFYFWK